MNLGQNVNGKAYYAYSGSDTEKEGLKFFYEPESDAWVISKSLDRNGMFYAKGSRQGSSGKIQGYDLKVKEKGGPAVPGTD